MTRQQLRARFRRIVGEHEDSEAEGGELNLVPYLDIVTNIIMFLMMTTSFAAALTAIPITAASRPGPGMQRDLGLHVHVSQAGLTVATADEVYYRDGALPTVLRVDGSYDYAALGRTLRVIKAAHPDATSVRLSANPAIPYETVVAVMDAVRSDGVGLLFPDLALAVATGSE